MKKQGRKTSKNILKTLYGSYIKPVKAWFSRVFKKLKRKL